MFRQQWQKLDEWLVESDKTAANRPGNSYTISFFQQMQYPSWGQLFQDKMLKKKLCTSSFQLPTPLIIPCISNSPSPITISWIVISISGVVVSTGHQESLERRFTFYELTFCSHEIISHRFAGKFSICTIETEANYRVLFQFGW